MPDQMTEKTLEVKVRALPAQERQDKKDLARVYFAKEALLELKLEAGQVCHLWKTDDQNASKKQAIVWPSTQKLNKNVIQMFKTFQETCGFKLEDRISVSASGDLMPAESILLKDVTSTEGVVPLSDAEKVHWEWFLEESIGRAECIFEGMTFATSLRGPRRVLQVHSIIGQTANQSLGIGKFTDASSVKIVAETAEETAATDVKSESLQIDSIPGLKQPLAKLNKFLLRLNNTTSLAFRHGVKRSTAVLLNGGSGTGKTMILRKLSNSGWGRVFKIDRETKPTSLPQIFRDAKFSKTSIITLDDLDILMSKDQARASMTLEYALAEELDNLYESMAAPRVLVIATAATISDVPQSLKTPGRFDTQITLPVPDANARKEILKFLARGQGNAYPPAWDELLERLGDRTHAYTGQDLRSLWTEVWDTVEDRLVADGQLPDDTYEDQSNTITQADIDQALLAVRPSAMHDVTLQPPKVRWDDIGGQAEMKKALRRAIEDPLLRAERILRLGGKPKKGLLLYGPPGCSKTLSAAACATELSHNFFAVKGPELLNMYVGESERAVRAVFARARAAAPAIIFFDEIESIATARRGLGGTAAASHGGVNVLTTLLNEMDGIESLHGVVVIAATNAPHLLDLALLRPGRFDELLYVAPPTRDDRRRILQLRARAMHTAPDVDLDAVADATAGLSGAEVVAVCAKAIDFALARCNETGREDPVLMEDFWRACAGPEAVKGRITSEMVAEYERWAAAVTGTAAPRVVEDDGGA